MLTKVDVTTAQGSLLSLPLHTESSLFIESIEGLDPVKATLVSSSFANQDGGQYHSSRREPRNIKMKLEFDPDLEIETVRDLRKRVYSFFMPKTQVDLKFTMVPGLDLGSILPDLVAHISAHVETCETAHFVKEPVVDISLMCFDPDFLDPTPVIISGSSTTGMTETPHIYTGTVETGLVFKLSPMRSVSAFSVYHRPPDGTLRVLDFSAPLVSGNQLVINTNVGNKAVMKIASNVESSLLYGLSPQSNWLELQPGENNFRVYAEGLPIPYTIEYTTRYGGL